MSENKNGSKSGRTHRKPEDIFNFRRGDVKNLYNKNGKGDIKIPLTDLLTDARLRSTSDDPSTYLRHLRQDLKKVDVDYNVIFDVMGILDLIKSASNIRTIKINVGENESYPLSDLIAEMIASLDPVVPPVVWDDVKEAIEHAISVMQESPKTPTNTTAILDRLRSKSKK